MWVFMVIIEFFLSVPSKKYEEKSHSRSGWIKLTTGQASATYYFAIELAFIEEW